MCIACLLQLNHCCVDDPTDLCVCNISGAGLRKVSATHIMYIWNPVIIVQYQAEDFAVFDNVAYINASDNHLPMGMYVHVCAWHTEFA